MRHALACHAFVITTLLYASVLAVDTIPRDLSLPTAAYPIWAHEHWVWLGAKQSNQSSVPSFVQGFVSHNISVGAVNIDSGWSTGYNNFVVDDVKYPDFAGLIRKFKNQGMKVVLWVTSMVNEESSNYNEMIQNRYHLCNAKGEPELVKWWHGKGLFLDYTNKAAVDWWHRQMDKIIDLGIDGWKTDGTDPSVLLIGPGDPRTSTGEKITVREYSTQYYSDFYYYTKSKNPEALIMSRPVDCQGGFCYEFSPRELVLSGWVGDDDPTWDGLKGCITKMAYSAWKNYPNFGCDMAGYKVAKVKQSLELYVRWVQLGAASPLMENGGNNEHRPWAWDSAGSTTVLDMYRGLVDWHHMMSTYLLTTGTTSLTQGHSSLIFTQKEDWTVTDYSYRLGNDVFVVPITVEGQRSMNITFPGCLSSTSPSSTSKQYDAPCTDEWVSVYDRSLRYKAGSTALVHFTLVNFPLFIRSSSLIPLRFTKQIIDNAKYHFASSSSPSLPRSARLNAVSSLHTFMTQLASDGSEDALTLLLLPQRTPHSITTLESAREALHVNHSASLAFARRVIIPPSPSTPFTATYSFTPLSPSSKCGTLTLVTSASNTSIIFSLVNVAPSSIKLSQLTLHSADTSKTITTLGEAYPTLSILNRDSNKMISSTPSPSSSIRLGYHYDHDAKTLSIRSTYTQGHFIQIEGLCLE